MKKLLILDDDEDIRFLIKMMLKPSGKYSILEAETGHQAHTLLQNEHVDFMIMDHMLPDGFGADLLKQWKQDGILKKTRVVMLTARRDDAMEKELAAAGVEKVFHKPFDPMTLATEVESLFGS